MINYETHSNKDILQPQICYKFSLNSTLIENTTLKNSLFEIKISKEKDCFNLNFSFRENSDGSILNVMQKFASLDNFDIIAYDTDNKVNYLTNVSQIYDVCYDLHYDYTRNDILVIKLSLKAKSIINKKA